MEKEVEQINAFDANTKVIIWSKIIDEQIHFNDIKSKNQTLFVSIITASMAAAGYLSIQPVGKNIISIYLCRFSLKVLTYTIPIIGAIIFTLAFYILDVGVYHTLLKGAVKAGQAFEKKYLSTILPSTMIEHHSEKDKTFGFIRGAFDKISWFYAVIGFSLFILVLSLNQ
jgi:hypothetical protein